MNSKLDPLSTDSICGYLEGYYGRLLSWTERAELVQFLSAQNLNTYCYAPKEDAQHRLQWREPYKLPWRESFAQFCRLANDSKVAVVAGIAPGLDFNFDEQGQISSDFDRLQEKANAFIEDGANHILVLWDDIEAGCSVDTGISEGTSHARVVNRLSQNLGQPVWTVPRVYAADIENNNNYLENFFAELSIQSIVLLCGNAIVASAVTAEDLARMSCARNAVKLVGRPKSAPGSAAGSAPGSAAGIAAGSAPGSKSAAVAGDSLGHRVVLWDNFYANDYCPRQLFLAPWTGREQISDYLLNPTGLPYTDRLLLDIVVSTHTSTDRANDWTQALKRHGVPEAFHAIAPYFGEPFFGDRTVLGDIRDLDCHMPNETVVRAIEICLWKWKSPLAREWYPFIMSLKQDLALMQGELPRVRVLKTQSPALAMRLLDECECDRCQRST